MRTKLKNRLTVILILLSFLVVSMVSVTIIFALSQQKISTEVGVEFYPVTPIDAFTFSDNGDGTYSVTGFNGSGLSSTSIKVLNIPKTYEGKPVTKIGNSAFYNCDDLIKVIIPDSVTSIGSSAFQSCSKLECIEIPDSVTSLGSSVIYNCTGLISVKIGKGVTSIGSSFGYGCTALTSIVVDSENEFYYSDGNCLISKSNGTIVVGCSTSVIPEDETVTSIGMGAFSLMPIVSIDIPDNITTIGGLAFSGCKSLTSVTIGKGLTGIGNYLFERCSNLQSITVDADNEKYYSAGNCIITKSSKTLVVGCVSSVIPDGVTSIGDYAFFGCLGLTGITIPDYITSIGYGAFDGCTDLKNVTIGSGVTSIGGYAFEGCSKLTSIEIPVSVTSIGKSAFYNCTGLTKVITSDINAWASINFGDYAANPLYYSQKLYLITDTTNPLTQITILSAIRIGSYAFYGFNNLTSVTIGNSVISIGKYAFRSCEGLTSVTFENSEGWYIADSSTATSGTSVDVTSANANLITWLTSTYSNKYWIRLVDLSLLTFTEADNGESYSLTKCDTSASGRVVIPATYNDKPVTSISAGAFAGCTNVTSVDTGSGVTSIGQMAFMSCSGLRNLVIGASVNSIDSTAFGSSYYLESIQVDVNNTTYRSSGNCLIETASKTLILGSNNSVIPTDGSVTSIRDTAFYNYKGLTSIIIPDSVTFIGAYAFDSCTALTSVTFENTEGWFVADSSSATSGTSVDVTSENSDLITWLTSTYSVKYWIRTVG